MPNRKGHNTSGIPGKAKASEDEENASALRRQEGTVNEHRDRVNRNNQRATDGEQKETSGRQEHGRRR